MDDFVISNLHESRNEWCGRLITILTPVIIQGVKSIFNESIKMCKDNSEESKYLMTFQNLLSRIPKWNNVIISEECSRITETSGCSYLEDLITCVHIIQLKVLTCIRVGNKQKKIDISIPKLDHFIHRCYINVARKLFTNIYLFEKNISDLQIQKNNRETEIIVQECILTTIRESIPTEAIIRAYMDEAIEDEEEVIIEAIEDPDKEENEKKENEKKEKKENEEKNTEEKVEIPPEELPPVLSVDNVDDEKVVTKLSFNDLDSVSDGTTIDAPKTIERLEEISEQRYQESQEEDDEDVSDKIVIHNDVTLDDVFDLDSPTPKDKVGEGDHISLDDIEDL